MLIRLSFSFHACDTIKDDLHPDVKIFQLKKNCFAHKYVKPLWLDVLNIKSVICSFYLLNKRKKQHSLDLKVGHRENKIDENDAQLAHTTTVSASSRMEWNVKKFYG